MKLSGGSDQKKEQVNTVRISAVELMKLDQEMSAKKSGTNPRRTFLRWPFQRQAILIEMQQPGGAMSQLRYACRNLSTTGLAILHSTYVHTGTRANVHLPDLEGNIHPKLAKIVRCVHYKGVIHEVGLRFDQPINVRDFVQLDPMEGAFTMEHVDPEKLNGAVLHVDDSAMDRRLVRHYLRDTNLNVTTCETGEQAIARAGEGYDVILCEHDLPDMKGTTLVEMLRAKGIQTPIIMTTGDARVTTQQEAREVHASAYLCKPFTQDQLLRAMAEFMLMEATDSDSGGPVYSTLTAADSAFGFVPEFAEELRGMVTKLAQAIDKKDTAVLKRVAAQIRGAAKGMGFAIIGSAADSTVGALERAPDAAETIRSVRSLMGLCTRVRVREPDRKAG